MRIKLAVSLIAWAVILWGGNRGADVLSDLNDCIQQRFLDTRAFGITRILPLHGIRQFRPENARERRTLEALEEKDFQVALFLAGRQILGPSNGIDPRNGVQGPAYMTHFSNTADLPQPSAFLEDARAALAAFDRGEGYQIQKNGWSVLMRPLRAKSETCVQCHTAGSGGKNEHLRVGDALGVVLYVYRGGPKVTLESAVNLR